MAALGCKLGRMFEGWHDFYLLIGGASGALIGLLFVVATLAPKMEKDVTPQGTPVYTTPTVFHLACVLGVSGLAMFPAFSLKGVGVCIVLAGLWGLAYTAWITTKLVSARDVKPAHWSDIWFYGVGPLGLYVVLVASGAVIWARRPFAADLLALTTLSLISLTIRNAWDLVTWIAPRVEQSD